jgi:hypothetical protein
MNKFNLFKNWRVLYRQGNGRMAKFTTVAMFKNTAKRRFRSYVRNNDIKVLEIVRVEPYE